MELHALKSDEIRGFDAAKSKDVEQSIRRELLTVRMDIYAAKSANVGRVRGLKRSLARLLTARRVVAGPAVRKAAKPVAAAPAKAASPKKKAKAAAPATETKTKAKKA